ncbi:MAG: M4 family metallopeptidase, partial [Chromatiaceae bacterium]|nr:M4 family metallopeptidase [Chromatiaceae bacterium]
MGSGPYKITGTFILGMVLVCALAAIPSTQAANSQARPDATANLLRDTDGTARISLHPATGVARFVRLSPNAVPTRLSTAPDPLSATNLFLQTYGAVFGIRNPSEELDLIKSSVDIFGMRQLKYRQVYRAIPVFGAQLRVHFNRDGMLTAINGSFIPDLGLNPEPVWSAAEAADIAVSRVLEQKQLPQKLWVQPALQLAATDTQLMVFRAGLARGIPGTNHLVYEVEVVNPERSIRELVYVDAHTGKVVDQITGIHHALKREVSESSLADLIWQDSAGHPDPIPSGWANGSAQQLQDWQNEIDGAREIYNLLGSMTNGTYLSYDGADAAMRTVNNDPSIACPNANWNGISTNYCSDVTGDDTVAHEWGHAVTDYTHALIYQWQPGALNEAYSDIWGEVVDLLNGRGNDLPDSWRTAGSCSSLGSGSPANDTSYRWLSGEDDPAFGGAIRDMWHPNCYGDPGKVSDPSYWCSSSDGGGVHTNSGVPNHAFALLADGGSYNGRTITGIGLTKASHIYWRAQSVYQTPASDFLVHADSLEAACADLIGSDLFELRTHTSSSSSSGEILAANDCTELSNAIAAVELRAPPSQCSFQPMLDPNTPALCSEGQSAQTLMFTDWESGLAASGWTVGTRDLVNPGTFSTPDWAVVDDLPAGAPAGSSRAAFVEDAPYGDCQTDIEAGVLYLQSPPLTVPAEALVPRLAFDHWVATELGWDGGNVKISVNGGPYNLLPGSAFEFNAYPGTLSGDANENPMATQEAFTGTDGGSFAGSWGQSQVNLAGIAGPGDQVRLRFEMGLDGCYGLVGWYIDNALLYYCSAEFPCGNGVLDVGESCDDANIDSGDGCSGSCRIESGWSCTDPMPGGNVVSDPGFEGGSQSASWDATSTNFGTPLCTVGTCGTGSGTGPNSGDWWAWFGGIAAYEQGGVSQAVTIPAAASTLGFSLEMPACDSASDYLEVTLDDSLVFVADGADNQCGVSGYLPITLDISAFADDGPHMLKLNSEIFAELGSVTNFFVDDVEIRTPDLPSVCTCPDHLDLNNQ